MSPKKTPGASHPASDLPEGFSAVDPSMVHLSIRDTHASPGTGVGGHRARREHARGRADGLGQDARRLPVVSRPHHRRANSGRSSQTLPGALHLAVEGPGGRRRTQPARSPGWHAARGHPPRPARAHGRGRVAFRRHSGSRTSKAHDQAARHFDHDSRVAVLDPHLCGARVAARHRHSDRRRVHAVRRTDSGAHLALSLERLDAMLEKPAQRIGLSATVRPVDEIADSSGGPRQATVVQSPAVKTFDISVVVPVEDMDTPTRRPTKSHASRSAARRRTHRRPHR